MDGTENNKNQAQSGKQSLTIDDIALALGVSKTTVSRAISGNGRISQETRDRVKAYVYEHDFHPNQFAKALAQNKTYNIALVIPRKFSDFSMVYFRKVMSAVYEMAAQHNYDTIILMAEEKETQPMIRLLNNHKIDGAVLTRALEDDPLIPLLKNSNTPFVVIGNVADPDVYQVDDDQVGGCREMVSYLLMKGIRRIAVLGGSRMYTVNQSRLDGFLDACKAAGIVPEQDLIFMELESPLERTRALESAISLKAECILAMDEEVANCAVRTLRHKKIQIPEQIKVASLYDNEALENSNPSVSAVQFNAFLLGQTAAAHLIDIMDGKAVEKKVRLGFQIVLRNSTKD